MSGHAMRTPLTTAAQLVQSALSALQSAQPTAESQEEAFRSLKLALAVLHGLDGYLDASSSIGPPVLAELIRETDTHDFDAAHAAKRLTYPVSASWSAGAYEGKLIATIARSTGARRVMEIGMFTGTTTLCIASALPEDGKVITLELDAYLRDLAQPYFAKAGVQDKIDVRLGAALESIRRMAEAGETPFDLIFLDADKPAYRAYYDAVLDAGLLRKGGVFLVDNTLYKASPYVPQLKEANATQLNSQIDFDNGKDMADFNAYVRSDPRVDVTILPVRDGVSWIMLK